MVATSITTQCNYMGWMAGALVVPLVVHSEESLKGLLFYQAVASCVVLLIFAAGYQRRSAGRPVPHRSRGAIKDDGVAPPDSADAANLAVFAESGGATK